MKYYTILDAVLLPIYIIFILMAANIYAKNRRDKDELYKYYLPGLIAKIVGGLGLAFVYTLYYSGGDTTEYFNNVLAAQRLAFYDFDAFWHVMTEKANASLLLFFNSETGGIWSYKPSSNNPIAET